MIKLRVLYTTGNAPDPHQGANLRPAMTSCASQAHYKYCSGQYGQYIRGIYA